MKLVLASVLGVAFLFVFYRAVQMQWPASYFGATDLSAYAISRGPLRYLLYRFAPVYLTCLFVAVSLDRVHRSAWIGSMAVAVVHGLTTGGVALWKWTFSSAPVRRGRRSIALMRAIELFGLLIVGWLGASTRNLLASLVPSTKDLTTTLWTALLAGVLGAFLVRVSRRGPSNDYELVRESARQIPEALYEMATKISLEEEADPNLVKAVMVVENLQRPKWFRRLEKAKSVILHRGSYGIMQVTSDAPLSDQDSIVEAVRLHFRGITVANERGNVDWDGLKEFAATYNPDPQFAALLSSAYSVVREKP